MDFYFSDTVAEFRHDRLWKRIIELNQDGLLSVGAATEGDTSI
jgi:hypothetical protein